MVELYFNLVINKKRTCDDTNKDITLVPVTYRDEVINLLTERGYDKNGNKI